ncbi:MAG: S41 family peptidase [Candidatus Pacebacteria bacterium]|nr:S41 family peptidase [Candidatus Paceibacterota bacterium]
MKKNKLSFIALRNIIVITLVFVLGAMIGTRYGNKFSFIDRETRKIEFKVTNLEAPKERENVDFSQFWEVWGILANDFIDQEKVDDEKMVDGAISGMTAALGDPYTMYLPPEDDKRAAESLAGAFYGVGIELGYIDRTVAVVAPLKGMPAEQAGVKSGDLIVGIIDKAKDLDEDTSQWTLNDAVNNIRGERGTTVTLKLLRPEESLEVFNVDIVRDQIVIPSVELAFEENNGKKVAHITLSRFGERTKDEWEEVVQKVLAEKNNISGIVLDMRNNPGGFFDGAIDIASEFIDNDVVVSQQGKYVNQAYKTKGQARLRDIPLTVLVNRGSASASEIVAGALRDDLGIKLIGEKTFGKGTVQDRRELSNGGGLHVTVAKWVLPSGSWIHKEGIPVDVEVSDDSETEVDEVVLKAIEVL